MKDELKLAGAFLALNAAVIALAVAGYIKSGMNFGAVLNISGEFKVLSLGYSKMTQTFSLID